jgi:putative oxidoreductase
MERVLGQFSAHLYAVLRVVAGVLYACHGAQKLFGVLGGMGEPGVAAPLLSLMGLAGVIEFFGGLLIAIGLFTGYVAFIASGQMAGAYFMAHFPRGFWPIANTGELAVLYCFIFLYIASRGGLKWSIDSAGAQSSPSYSSGMRDPLPR